MRWPDVKRILVLREGGQYDRDLGAAFGCRIQEPQAIERTGKAATPKTVAKSPAAHCGSR